MPNRIRTLESRDHDALVEVYRQSVLCSTSAHYSQQQLSAWASQCEAIRPQLSCGKGLVICSGDDQPEAFCLRHPDDRIALFYCSPQKQRRGLGRTLLQAMEHEALKEEQTLLRTEASLISRPLFETMGWTVTWREELHIAGVHFHRFRMHKLLQQGY
jgi:putative acetyltransferase